MAVRKVKIQPSVGLAKIWYVFHKTEMSVKEVQEKLQEIVAKDYELQNTTIQYLTYTPDNHLTDFDFDDDSHVIQAIY